MDYTTHAAIVGRVSALSGNGTFDATKTIWLTSLINRRSSLAYEATDFWPRFLVVGESRNITSNYIPYTQGALSTIDTFLRIHKTYQPFYQYSSIEFEYYVDGLGAHIISDTSSTSTAYVTYKKAWDGPYTTASTNIPGEWFDYIAQGVLADYLRQDGQTEKAQAEEKIADDILQNQLMKTDVTRSVGVLSHRISTNLSRAYRRG
tara:strand:+ start:46 stop:660 length:615 start_codon:yes stop_codon:yes gene_type:complete